MDKFWDIIGAMAITLLIICGVAVMIAQTAILAYSMGWVK